MARTVAGTAAMAVVALLGFAGILAVVGQDDPWVLLLVAPVVVVPLAIGSLIVWRRQGNAVGWVLIADAALLGLAFAVEPYARYALVANAGSLPGGRWALLWDQADWPTLFAGATALALVFPDGRLPSRRWRPLAIFVAASFVAAIVAGMLHPDRFPAVYGTADSPLPHVQAAVWLLLPSLIGILAGLFAAAWAVRVRLRRAGGVERMQLLWFAYAATLLPLALLICLADGYFTGGTGPLSLAAIAVAATALSLSTGVALFRYQLFDVELALSRTLIYGSLTLLVLAISTTLVVLLNLVLHSTGVAGGIAAAVAALSVQPLHRRLQRIVERLVYGERSDPYAALSTLGQRLESAPAGEEVLATIVGSVAGALRVPHAVIELERGGTLATAASVGVPGDERIAWFPLSYQGEVLGRLGVVAPRGESLTAADRRLLTDLARQSGVAVHGVRVMDDLQRSRERLVMAREEERRRVRRDLHDGLGPTLAGMVLKLSAAKGAAITRPADAERLIGELTTETQEAIAEIRRLVDGLRPPALDELGLLQALQSQVTRLGPCYRLSGPERLPELPAAVEVAAYRIASEALTNAARHADAGSCELRIAVNGMLELEVEDDGRGMTAHQGRGIGMRSMRDRADELGGAVTIAPGAGGGTLVRLTLPIETP
jgi:signal transduction histidine kinase